MCKQQLFEKKTIRGGSAAQFPGKLHGMLEYIEKHSLECIISWNRDGKSFEIHDADNLVKVLPIFFEQTKYRSFRRQLNMWHFERILDGPNKGGFHHPFFVKGNKELCSYMSRDAKVTPQIIQAKNILFNHQCSSHLLEPTPIRSSSLQLLNVNLFNVASANRLTPSNGSQNTFAESIISSFPAQPCMKNEDNQACFAGRNFFPLNDKHQISGKSSLEKEDPNDDTRLFPELPIIPFRATFQSLLDTFLSELDAE